jgi:hypothetical protein
VGAPRGRALLRLGALIMAVVGDCGDGARLVRDVTISESVVRISGWHAGIFLAGVRDVRVIRSDIHNNGDESDPVGRRSGRAYESW